MSFQIFEQKESSDCTQYSRKIFVGVMCRIVYNLKYVYPLIHYCGNTEKESKYRDQNKQELNDF